MGSLVSTPSIPKTKIVSVPVATANTSSTTTDASADTAPDNTSETATSEARSQSLLQRDRSRFGTIRTSFQGLLGLSDKSDQRKTLLGQ